MKKIFYFIFIALFCSCEGESEGYKTTSKGSSTKAVIEQNIDELEKADWSRDAYLEIKDQQINYFKGTPHQKEALLTKLDFVYGKVMVRDANKILDNCSYKLHKTLDAIMKELANFANAPGKADVEAKYHNHQEMMKFIPSMKKLQAVNDFNTRYDKSFETTIKGDVAKYKKTNPTCSYINDELNKMDSYFKNRRNEYAKKIVDLYCAGTTYSSRDESRVISNINEACKSVSPELQDKIDQFKTIHNPPAK